MAGMALWAPWQWGPGFMAFSRQDVRDYTTPWYKPNTWFTPLCDKIVGSEKGDILTIQQGLNWGTIYMTLRGAMMYPLFIALAVYLTPWCALAGMLCLTQGLVYHFAASVLKAEYRYGNVFGAAKAICLIVYMLTMK